VGHGGDLDPPGDEDPEDGVVGQAAGEGHGHRSQAGDLAALALQGEAPQQCLVVHPDVDHGLRAGGGVIPVGGAGQVDEGVGPVGVGPLVPAAGPGVGHHPVAAGVDLGQQASALVGGEAGGQAHGAVPVGPGPQVAAPAQLAVALLLVGGGGLDPAALLPQLGQRQLLRGVEELLLGRRALGGGVGDLHRLGLREAPRPEGGGHGGQVVEEPGHLHGGDGPPHRDSRLGRHPRRRRTEPLPPPAVAAVHRPGGQHPAGGGQLFHLHERSTSSAAVSESRESTSSSPTSGRSLPSTSTTLSTICPDHNEGVRQPEALLALVRQEPR
jgi:hypothetical protein